MWPIYWKGGDNLNFWEITEKRKDNWKRELGKGHENTWIKKKKGNLEKIAGKNQ